MKPWIEIFVPPLGFLVGWILYSSLTGDWSHISIGICLAVGWLMQDVYWIVYNVVKLRRILRKLKP